MRIKMAFMKVWIGHDGATRDFIECDVLCGQVGRTGNHHSMAHAIRMLQCPAQGLHAT